MRRTTLTLVAAAIILVPAVSAAQYNYGDGFGIGGVLLPSGSPTLLATTRIGDSMGLEFSLSLEVFDDDNTSTTDIESGIGIRKFLGDRSQFQPYLGGRFGVLHRSYDFGGGNVDDTQFGVTAAVGGEYFVTRKLSFEGQIEFGVYFGSFSLGTGSRLAALFYL